MKTRALDLGNDRSGQTMHHCVGDYILFMYCRYNTNAQEKRAERTQAFEVWEAMAGHSILDRLAA